MCHKGWAPQQGRRSSLRRSRIRKDRRWTGWDLSPGLCRTSAIGWKVRVGGSIFTISPHLVKLLCHTVLEALVRCHVTVLPSAVHKYRVDWGDVISKPVSHWSLPNGQYVQSLPNFYFRQTESENINWHDESWMQSVVVSQFPSWASVRGRRVVNIRRRPTLQGKADMASLSGALVAFMPTQVTDTHSHPLKNILFTQYSECGPLSTRHRWRNPFIVNELYLPRPSKRGQ